MQQLVKFTKFAFILSFCLIAQARGAHAALCSPHEADTSLYYKIHTVEYVRNISSEDLKNNHFRGTTNGSVLGLAGGEVGLKFEVKFNASPYHGKKYCLEVTDIDANFYAKPKIYIANNFARGSCEYNRTLRHEQQHVKILTRAHKEYTPLYRRYLREVARDIPILEPFRIEDVHIQKQRLLQHINNELSAYMNEITADVDQRQKAIDTPEEYERVYSKCKRWEKKLNVND